MADTLTFAVPVEWSKTTAYEQNIIVFVGKRAYTSLKAVPTGIEITDTSYWAETGVTDTTQLKADIETLKGNVSTLKSNLSTTNSNVTANNNAITSIRQDITTLKGNVSTLQSDLSTTNSNVAANEDTITGMVEGYLLAQSFSASGSASGVTVDIVLIAGITFTITVESVTRTGAIEIFTDGHNKPALVTNAVGVYTFTPEYTGKMRVYFTNSGENTISGTVCAKGTRFDEVLEGVTEDVNNIVVPTAVKATPSVFDLQIKKNYVFDSVVTHANKSIKNLTGLTIENYESKLAASSIQTITEPIRVRDIYDGSLVYNNLHIEGPGSYNDSVAMTTFDRDGNYLRQVQGNALDSRTETFLADEYFAILSEYTSYSHLRWMVDDVEIEWLNPSHKRSA